MIYNYYLNMENDVTNWIDKNVDFSEFDTIDDLQEYLYDTLWAEDSITGTASGSYTFDSYKAEEYICHNLDLLDEACQEFCITENILTKGAEYCDVTIRCYLLYNIIANVLEKYNKIFDK